VERKISFRLTDEQETLITAAAKKWNTSDGDVIRRAVDAYLNPNKSQQNLETILYEIVKTRACILRTEDMKGKAFTADLLEEAGKDAQAYLEARRKTC